VVFVVVGIFQWPMVPVVIIAIPASFALAWFTDKGPKGGKKNG